MKLNQLKAGVILSYISIVISNIISILYTPFMLKKLGQTEYGLYTLASSAISYLSILGFGLINAYVRFYSSYKVKCEKENIAKLNGMFMIVYLMMSCTAVVIGGILIANVNQLFEANISVLEMKKMSIIMFFMLLNMVLSFPNSIFAIYIAANECFVFQRMVQLVVTIGNPVITSVLLLMGYKSVMLAFMQFVWAVFNLVLNSQYCFKRLKMKFYFRAFDIILFKEIFRFSVFLGLEIVANQINWQLDKILLGKFSSIASVAVYGLASTFQTYFVSFATPISGVYSARISSMVMEKNKDKEITEIFTKIGRLQFVFLIFVYSGFVLFGKEFIVLFWAGKEYTAAYYIALLLMGAAIIPNIQTIGVEVQRAKNKHQMRVMIYFFISLLNLICSIPLCKLYGGIGCAIATAFSVVLGDGFILNWLYKEKIGINMNYFWTQIGKCIPAVCFAFLTGIIYKAFVSINNLILLFYSILFYIIVFICFYWKLGANQYEKSLILDGISKIIKRRKKN